MDDIGILSQSLRQEPMARVRFDSAHESERRMRIAELDSSANKLLKPI
jgi:hypothetical protein